MMATAPDTGIARPISNHRRFGGTRLREDGDGGRSSLAGVIVGRQQQDAGR